MIVDGIAIAVSVAAVWISVRTYWMSGIRDRERALAEVFSLLLTEDAQEGRRLLFEAGKDPEVWKRYVKPGSPQWSKINRALALLEYVAFARAQGWLPAGKKRNPDPLLLLWFNTTADLSPYALRFIAYRRKQGDWAAEGPLSVWPNAVAFMAECVAYRDQLKGAGASTP